MSDFFRTFLSRAALSACLLLFLCAFAPTAPRSETEAALIDSLRIYSAPAPRPVPAPLRDSLVLEADSLYRLPRGFVIDESVCADLVFDYDPDDSAFFLVDDPEYFDATVRNLFCGTVPSGFDLRLSLEVRTQKYGSSRPLEIKAEDLLCFASERGYIPYWGLGYLDEDRFDGALFLVNRSACLAHLLRLSGSPAALEDSSMVLSGTAFLLIPIDNISTLYGENR